MNGLIFAFGALRSGSTVFKLMLDSNKDISCSGEADFIFDYLKKHPASGKWTYDLESLRLDRIFQLFNLDIMESDDGKNIALNFVKQLRQRTQVSLVLVVHRNLNKLVAIFPDAKIIHLIRDPRDVAKSCIAMGWAGNTYFAIDEWIKTESSWDDFGPKLQKNNAMDVFYELLISDPVGQLEEICRFICVSFSPDMLNYPNWSTYDAPNISAIQRWRNVQAAREIALIEIKARPLLLQRHYELSGYPLNPPHLIERIRLRWTNKIYKWKFELRRFGALNFIMEKITRKFAIRFYPVFRQRLNEIEKRHLK